MAIKSNEDLMNGIRSILGDRTDEAALGLLEDVDDTLKDYATNANIDWKNKYDENDAAWKQKYRDRFFGTVVDDDNLKDEPEEKKLTYDSLFKEE